MNRQALEHLRKRVNAQRMLFPHESRLLLLEIERLTQALKKSLDGGDEWMRRALAAEHTLVFARSFEAGSRSNINEARRILWQEGDFEGTPLIVLAEARMSERDAALERERLAVDVLKKLEREFVARGEWGASPQDVSMWKRMVRTVMTTVKKSNAAS